MRGHCRCEVQVRKTVSKGKDGLTASVHSQIAKSAVKEGLTFQSLTWKSKVGPHSRKLTVGNAEYAKDPATNVKVQTSLSLHGWSSSLSLDSEKSEIIMKVYRRTPLGILI
uniref:Fatty-acid-binding protein 3, chloroplastic isoform X1 n=1 Tax=Tanacetum cinerariifolium TaxID=118510 RepID=A0A6L2L4V0_TANCI|nr:fatty-acid-binding protein 3, chloroplastic isoform X1 [Tanacetum cinerariifolium]